MEKFIIKPLVFRKPKGAKEKVQIACGMSFTHYIYEIFEENGIFKTRFSKEEWIGLNHKTFGEAEQLCNEHFKKQLIQTILKPFEEVPSDNEVDIQKYYEDNCIKISSADDLPTEDCNCWILDKEKGWKAGRWVKPPNEREFINASEFWVKHATHYVIVPEPKEIKEA